MVDDVDPRITPVIVDSNDNWSYANVNEQNVLLVEGLEDWVDTLKKVKFCETFMHLSDSKTGAEFLIKRVK